METEEQLEKHTKPVMLSLYQGIKRNLPNLVLICILKYWKENKFSLD